MSAKNIALLVIDMQKAFFTNNSKRSMRKAVDYINYAVDLFRNNDKKIIWVQDDKYTRQGTEGFEIIDLLEPKDGEKRIVKHYGNSFNKTDLLECILKEKIDTVIITGYCAEYCVLSTYRGALDCDLTPKILKNAIASGNDKNMEFVENVSDLITVNELEKNIQNGT